MAKDVCPCCGGSGKIPIVSMEAFTPFVLVVCGRCNGSGMVPLKSVVPA